MVGRETLGDEGVLMEAIGRDPIVDFVRLEVDGVRVRGVALIGLGVLVARDGVGEVGWRTVGDVDRMRFCSFVTRGLGRIVNVR